MFHKGDRMKELTEKQQKEVKRVLRQKIMEYNIECIFVPSAELKNLIIKNEHPAIASMPQHFKEVILHGPMRLDNKMVLDYIDGNLDAQNKFVLDHGDVRVTDNSISLQKGKI